MEDRYLEEIIQNFTRKQAPKIWPQIQQILDETKKSQAEWEQKKAQWALEDQQRNMYNNNTNTFELSAIKEEPRYAEITNKPYSGPEIYSKPAPEIYTTPDGNPKYAGLKPMQKLQKAASKSPVSTTEGHYYGLASRFNDGEKLSRYDKEQNNIYQVKDFQNTEHGQGYAEKAAKMQGLDINNPNDYERIQNTRVVMPKENSALHNHIKNSDTTKEWVAKNYEKYKNGTIQPEDQHITYGLDKKHGAALFGTIHNAEMKKSQINPDGSFTVWPDDGYDYDKWKYKDLMQSNNFDDLKRRLSHNVFTYINNNAYEQQQRGQLENYILSAPVTYTKEEVDGIINATNNNQTSVNKLLNDIMKRFSY